MADSTIDPFQILREGVCCQQRTASHKKFTVNHDKRIIKFPYTTVQASALRDRFVLLVGWSTQHLVVPKAFLCLSREMGSPEGNLAIEYPNVGTRWGIANPRDVLTIGDTMCIENSNISHIQESFSPYSYRSISERKGLVKVSDLLREATKSATAIRDVLPGLSWVLEQATSVTTTLVKLTIAGVGDRGLYNVLANTTTHEVFVIDIEEDQSHLPNSDPWFYLTKPPAKAFRDVWNSHVHWQAVIDNIVRTVPSTYGNYQHVLPLLQQMGPVYGQVAGLVTVTPASTPMFNFVDSVPTASSSQSHVTTAPLQSNPPPTIGKMSYSFRHSTTYSGYADDEVRSGLQKYIRRGEAMKAIQCGYELYRMAEIHPDAKRLVTNLYNRLMVIATEDIGPGDVNICMLVMEFVHQTKEIQGALLPQQVVAVIQACAQAPKTRVLSHLWRVYATPMGQAAAGVHGITIDDISCTPQQITWPGAPTDHPLLMHCSSIFAERLVARSPSAFTWLARYMAMCEDKTVKISPLRRRTNPIEALWVIIEGHISARDYQILRDSYYYLSENRGCLMMAVYLAVWQVSSTPVTTITELAQLWQGSPQLTQLQTGGYILVLDDYVVDKHTKRGRGEGKDRTVFVNEGAVVHHRAAEFDQPWFLLLEKIYQTS